MNFYNVLDCNKRSNQCEIKSKYRQLSKKHHPDKGGDAAHFRLINEAYNVIGNEHSKTVYDRKMLLRKKTPDVILNLDFDFCHFYIGCTRKISLKRFKLCTYCRNVEKCTKCTDGLLISKENVLLKLPCNSMIGCQIVIYGKSNEKLGFETGNLIVNTSCKPLKKGFTLHNSDIICDIWISIYDRLAGFKRTIDHIDGSGKLIINTELHNIVENQIRYVGKGLLKENNSRGDLLVRMNIKDFNIVTNEVDKSLIKKILNI